jgi:bifunctional DNA-binding transcriptional regulator/antitoxin component of YhaV-PrlF toxin-antitoxin module
MKVLTPIQTKDVKISSKGQITLPKAFLDQMDLSYGQNVIIQFAQDRLEIINKQSKRIQKLREFKPVKLGTGKIVNYSETHNEIYD